MNFIKKNYLLVFGSGIIILYLFTRFYNILSLPIFTDEAIYVRWAQIAGTDSAQRFISLTDGKQPSFVWIAAVLMKFIADPLLAGRLVSVFAGLGSVIGMFFLTSEIFKNPTTRLRAYKIGLFTSFIYVIYPFSLMYDRLALYDSLVSLFIIWSLYFEILLVRYKRLDIALILGMIIGGGILTKTNAYFALILLPFLLLLFNFKEKKWRINLGKLVILSIVTLVISIAMYSILRLSTNFHIIGLKNNVFVYPFNEWIMHPFTFLSGNLKGLSEWFLAYLTAPFFILSISSFFVEKKYFREKLLLFVWFLAPFTALALFGKVIYPRFILFMTMPLLILGAYTFYNMIKLPKKVYIKVLVALVFLGTFFVNDFLILTNFQKSFVPEADKNQFLSSWPSGVGVKETIKFLKDQSEKEEIYVGTQGTFGLMPYALEIYLKDNNKIETQGFWPVNDAPPKEALDAAAKKPTYFVFYQPCSICPQTGIAPVSWGMKKVFQIPKAEKGSYYTLYKLTPQ
ncbi:MAG TPA: glycosyltransferase family 39 protein [Candidatus Limnocylindrales bacterium]|nr:glycosyltransferase family 39 protein [Candidatus Limnocylindrales bacterium]